MILFHGGEFGFHLKDNHGDGIYAQLVAQYGENGTIPRMVVAFDIFQADELKAFDVEREALNIPVKEFWRTYHKLVKDLMQQPLARADYNPDWVDEHPDYDFDSPDSDVAIKTAFVEVL